jgi:hypothetical protein
LEVGVPAWAEQEFAHHEQAPPLADHVERPGERAVLSISPHLTKCTLHFIK